ncbi:MAG: ribonuclease P protein component [Candidatus Acidiferrales bacterium]
MSGTGRLTLPRECRLLRGSDYEAVYSEGRRRSGRYFAVFLRRNNSDVSRFGWSIKKATGNAVRRNFIRRRLREIVRLHRHQIGGGWDVVIHPRDSARAAEFSELSRDLLKLLPSR